MGWIADSFSNRGTRALSLLAVVGLGVGAAFGQGALQGIEKTAGTAVAETPKRSPEGSPLRTGCGTECGWPHVSGKDVTPPPSVVASPSGTTYSVHHHVGADFDGAGPEDIRCFSILAGLPGAPDDIVLFDGTAEAIRTDILGTVPIVTESDTPQPNGRRLIEVATSAPSGRDLFPAGFESGGVPLTDACFMIGIDDSLDWIGADTVVSATIEFLTDDVVQLGPLDASFFIVNPWNGVTTITLPGGAGRGYNGVRLSITVEKSIVVGNDDCRGQVEIFDGPTFFSTIGATTDGPEEPAGCQFFLYSDIGSDVWYRYRATCTGILTVDLCDSTYDTKFAIYDQCLNCPIDPGPLGCNDDYCGQRSFAVVPVVEDQCLTLRVGGYLGLQGSGTLNLSCDVAPPPTGACCGEDGICIGTLTETACVGQNATWFEGAACPGFSCPVTAPSNDLCENGIRVLTNQPYHGRTIAATGTDISSCVGGDTKDVWNYWTADCAGEVSVTTCGSDFDTSLAAYTSCGGAQFACDDDGCPQVPGLRSKITFNAAEGTTYFFRVAGFQGAVGHYTLTVESCKNACCHGNGACDRRTAAQCLALESTPLGNGTVCLGDADQDGINDACEECPQATIASAAPVSGTVDARQPHARNAATPRQGIGSPGVVGSRRESIVIVLSPPVSGAEGCFRLCETGVDLLPNDIQSVTYQTNGVYEMVLNHAIAVGQVTTIEYVGDGSSVEYISHPSNVEGTGTSDGNDIQEHIDCCLNGICTPMWGAHSCEIDRSNLVTPADLLFLIDLQNGTQLWTVWGGTVLPPNPSCP